MEKIIDATYLILVPKGDHDRAQKIYQSINPALTGFITAEITDYDNLKGIIKEVDARISK